MSTPSGPRRTTRKLLGLGAVVAFAALATASGPDGEVDFENGGFGAGFAEGTDDAIASRPFDPASCGQCPEPTEPPGEGEGEGEGCASYGGPNADPQRDPNCQAAWSAGCAGQDKSAYCGTYNASGWGSPGNCPYC